MFGDCPSLTSLNLSNFDISKVTSMKNMFSSCLSLTSLNLSNFIVSDKDVNNIFKGSINLEYINIISFIESSKTRNYYKDMFKNVPDNIVVCINKGNIINKIYPQIENKTCYVEDCTDNWKLKQKKTINGTNECINNCSDNNLLEYNNKCYSKSLYGYFIDNNNNIKCKCELEKCLTCPTVALSKKLCTKCNDKYYQMENDPSNIGEYFNCYNETPKGYYFDINILLYKKCYESCQTCEIKGNNVYHNCLKCNNEFYFELNINNYSNCYKECIYYYCFLL